MKNKPSPRLSVLPLAVAFDDSASIDHTVYAHLCAVMCVCISHRLRLLQTCQNDSTFEFSFPS